MRTNAMPVSMGKFESNPLNASNPPADAPIPTTGKLVRGGES
jgi:hypothetical protein